MTFLFHFNVSFPLYCFNLFYQTFVRVSRIKKEAKRKKMCYNERKEWKYEKVICFS